MADEDASIQPDETEQPQQTQGQQQPASDQSQPDQSRPDFGEKIPSSSDVSDDVAQRQPQADDMAESAMRDAEQFGEDEVKKQL